MKVFLLMLAMFILSMELLFSQEKTDIMIFGDVREIKSKEHIPYANIFLVGTTIGTIADGSGHYKLTNIPVGKHRIAAKAIGYKTQEIEIEVTKGMAKTIFFELEPDVLNLNQVVITGTRTEHILKDAPVRTEIISAKSIENKNACNIYQALEGTPGVRVENQCQSCNFTMVRMQGLGSEHTQVLINGQPMYSGLAGVYGLQQLSTVDIEKIEIVKGAGSALYGSGAVAGAINIVSKEPSFEPSTSLDVQFGSFKTNKFDLSSSIRNTRGNIGLNVYAQRYTEGAIDQTGAGKTKDEVKNKDGISDRVLTNLTNAGFSLYVDSLLFKNDKLIIRGKSVFEKREGGIMSDDYYRNPLTDGTENITTDRYEASLSYNNKWKRNSELNYTLAFINHNRNATNDSYLGDYMATHNDSIPDLREMRPYLANENSFISSITFSKKISTHNLIGGLQVFYDELEESGMYVVVDSANLFYGKSYRSIADKHAFEIGAFLQDEWALSNRWVIVPGIRIDQHQSGESYKADRQVSENNEYPSTSFKQVATNPRMAIKFKATEKITIRANAGTGFRAPYGFSEDLHLCSGSPRVWKSSDLQPETSLSVNMSADYYGSNLRVSTNVFRTRLKNKIGFTDAEPNISALGYDYQWKNIDHAFVQGIEFSVLWNALKKMDIGIDITYNQGEYDHARKDWKGTAYEEQSKFISRFPDFTGNIKIEYSPKTWVFSINGSLQGSMYIDYYNEEIDPMIGDQTKIKKTKPFALVNAKVSRRFEHFKVYAGVNNLFNHLQDERHLDDAAFMYAPVYGTQLYAGISVSLSH